MSSLMNSKNILLRGLGGGGSFTGITTDSAFIGDGTPSNPLKINYPLIPSNNDSTATFNQYGMSINDGRGLRSVSYDSIGEWDDTKNIVSSNSADWTESKNVLSSNSGDWNNTKNIVSANSGDWNNVVDTVANNSGTWTGGGGNAGYTCVSVMGPTVVDGNIGLQVPNRTVVDLYVPAGGVFEDVTIIPPSPTGEAVDFYVNVIASGNIGQQRPIWVNGLTPITPVPNTILPQTVSSNGTTIIHGIHHYFTVHGTV